MNPLLPRAAVLRAKILNLLLSDGGLKIAQLSNPVDRASAIET